MKENQTLERVTYTADEVAKILGVGRASVYEGIKNGTIPSIRVSPRRIVVPREALEGLLRGAQVAA